MDILLNGEKLQLGKSSTIDDLQGIIESLHSNLGEGIVETVEVDGEEYTTEEIEENKELNMDEVSRVNFITAASDDLKSSITYDVKEKLPEIRKDFKRSAAELTLGNAKKGAEITRDALESLHINYIKLEAWLQDSADEQELRRFYSLKEDYDDVIEEIGSRGEKEAKALTEMAEVAIKLIENLEEFIETSDTLS